VIFNRFLLGIKDSFSRGSIAAVVLPALHLMNYKSLAQPLLALAATTSLHWDVSKDRTRPEADSLPERLYERVQSTDEGF
jgi:hypothetical protein